MIGRERPTTSCLLGQEAQCRFHSDDLSFYYFISRGPEFPYDLRDKLSTLVIFILGFQSIRPGSRCGLLSHARSHRLFALNACLPWRVPTSKMANFRLLFGVLSSRRRHLKPNHLSPHSQSQHLANSHQPRRSDTSINSCPFLYNPAPFPNKAEFSGELLLCIAPFLSVGIGNTSS